MDRESNEARIKRCIAHVRTECVLLPEDKSLRKIAIIIKWCEENIGEDRCSHPIYEAEQGWLDYFEGDWAYTYEYEVVNFWIAKESHRVLFKLTWCYE